MFEFPANKLVTPRYIADVRSDLSDTKAFGGLYATATDLEPSGVIEVPDLHTPPEFNQKWHLAPHGRGIKLLN
ncbi:hypothetical protein RhiJN_21552 [Ceratobasidium sp. AG-Ba]|nr:hypothetical protein RhiJN_21552 [Ceratobasidium sp. AG-Ba]